MQTYIAIWQGHDLQEKIHRKRFTVEWKTTKVFPYVHFAVYDMSKSNCKNEKLIGG